MNTNKSFFSLLIITLCFNAIAEESKSKENMQASAFEYINTLRNHAGMLQFSKNSLLEKAALNHAFYGLSNNVKGHYERQGDAGYTGNDHIERINYVGYLSRDTGENVSSHKGEVDEKSSVDGLMSAIYHRFGFLSFKFDELGVGVMLQGDKSNYVYNMGSTAKEELCTADDFREPGHYFSSVCRDKDFRIRSEDFNSALLATQKKSQPIILWPPVDGSDIPPAFFEESPDPLPAYGVSGYPVSIQFNPSAFQGVTPLVNRFELFNAVSGEQIELIMRMDKESDPNNKFNEYEHAIFPRYRLHWAKPYRAEVEYSVQGKTETIVWEFRTRELNYPTYLITEDQQLIKEESGRLFVVYIPPRWSDDAKRSYRTQYKGLNSLEVKVIDGNTLLISAQGRGEANITFHGITFKVSI